MNSSKFATHLLTTSVLAASLLLSAPAWCEPADSAAPNASSPAKVDLFLESLKEPLPIDRKIIHDKEFDDIYANLLKTNIIKDGCQAFLIKDSDYCAFPYLAKGPIYMTEALYRTLESPDLVTAALAHELALVRLGYVSNSRSNYYENPLRPWLISEDKRNAAETAENLSTAFSYSRMLAVFAGKDNYWGYMPAFMTSAGTSEDYAYFELAKKQTAKADRDAAIMCYVAGFEPTAYSEYLKKVSSLAQGVSPDTPGDLNMWLYCQTDVSERLKDLEPTVQILQELDKAIAEIAQVSPNLPPSIRSQAYYFVEEHPKMLEGLIKNFRNSHPERYAKEDTEKKP